MRNRLKASTIESKFPLLSVEHGCIISKDADITVAFRVDLPELFTVTSAEYEAIHAAWVKAVKVLPNYSVVHKQDWFVSEKYRPNTGDGDMSFLSRSYERHFNERPFLSHSCYLFLTKTTKERMRMQSNFSSLCRGKNMNRRQEERNQAIVCLDCRSAKEKNKRSAVKRLILIMCVAVFGFTFQAKAQWAVLDPSNLVQNIQQVVKSSATVSNLVSNVQETVKIYEQGKAYYDALKSVNNLIKDARKVKLTIEMISEITNIYSDGFGRMASDPNFSVSELEAIALGYAKLLEEGGALVTELKNVVTPGNGLSLSDKERMDAIDQIYTKMCDYRNLTKYYTNKNISISFIRSRQKGDMERVRALYGKPSERYW